MSSKGRFHASVMKIYRAVAGDYFKKGCNPKPLMTDEDLLQEYCFLSPCSLIRLSRVCLFIRIVSKKSQYLLSLFGDLHSIGLGWIPLLCEDISILSSHPDVAPLAGRNIHEIANIIALDVRYWYKTLRKVIFLPYFSIVFNKERKNDIKFTLICEEYICIMTKI